MTHLEKIERKIKALGSCDLARFRAWFAEYDAANWDAKVEADAAAGKLDALTDKTSHASLRADARYLPPCGGEWIFTVLAAQAEGRQRR